VAFKVIELRTAYFPDEGTLSSALSGFGLPLPVIRAALESFVCKAAVLSGQGYQQHIARELEDHLASRLRDGEFRTARRARYSPRLNEQADLAIGRSGLERQIFVEIEFRPNVEKDLVKFQIGSNTGRLAAAVLILATDRKAINTGYKTMPEFGKFSQLIRELAPQYPLFLVGISGCHE